MYFQWSVNFQVKRKTAVILPEFGVLRVHHGWALGEDLGDAYCTDLFLHLPRYFLHFRYHDLLQHHAKHSDNQINRKKNKNIWHGMSYRTVDGF